MKSEVKTAALANIHRRDPSREIMLTHKMADAFYASGGKTNRNIIKNDDNHTFERFRGRKKRDASSGSIGRARRSAALDGRSHHEIYL